MFIAAPQSSVLAATQRLVAARSQPVASSPTGQATAEPGMPASAWGAVAPAGASVQMLVAIAASSPDAVRRRAVAPADRALRSLDRLDRRLRLGQPVGEILKDLTDWTRERAMPDDPAAARLVREVELRVRVELARLETRDERQPRCLASRMI